MNNNKLKDHLDFYEKIIKVMSVNDKIVNELTGAMVSLHALTTFNMYEAKFDAKTKDVTFFANYNKEIYINDHYNDIFRLVYLKYLCELYLKDNKGLRLIKNYIDYTHSDFNDLDNGLYSYIELRKKYVDDNKNIDFIKHHIYSLQDRLNNIETLLLEELE